MEWSPWDRRLGGKVSPGRRTCPRVCGRASGASLLSRARPRPGGRCGCRLSSVVCRLSTVFIFVVPGPLGWAGGERLGVFGALFSHALAAPRVPFPFFSTSALAWGDYCFLGTPFSRPPPGWAVPCAGGVLVGCGLWWRLPALAHPLWWRLAFFYNFLEPAPLCCVHRCGCLAAPFSAPPSTPWLGG